MSLSTTARLFHARFIAGGYGTSGGTYGGIGDTYGEAELTYGADAGESAVLGAVYIIVPEPGWRGATPAWVYRRRETERQFRAMIVNRDDMNERLDLDAVSAAELVLTSVSFNGEILSRRGFALSLDTTNDVVYLDWDAADLSDANKYVICIRVIFASGRYMTIESDDEITLEVQDGALTVEGS